VQMVAWLTPGSLAMQETVLTPGQQVAVETDLPGGHVGARPRRAAGPSPHPGAPECPRQSARELRQRGEDVQDQQPAMASCWIHGHQGQSDRRATGDCCSANRPRCPVSLIMRHGQRAELRCLKYLRRLRASVVSPIMRQIDALSVLSHQVKEPLPHLDETTNRMPYIRAACLGLDETGHQNRPI
jgi:hypothetical protein